MPMRETIADLMRATAGVDMAPPTAAVIVAAGNSVRMGGGTSKQLLELCGIPVLAHTLKAFQHSRMIDEIVVVTRPEDRTTVKRLQDEFGITKLTQIVQGGETRAESVKNGVAAIGKHIRYVAIHDGARCLVTPDMIRRVLRAAYIHRAATAATTVTDTVKLANKRGFIDKTVDRRHVWLAQTPQVFHADLYRAALATAKTQAVTDDNQLMEQIGFPVKLVNCGHENLKITTPEDIGRAEDILARRKRA